MVHGGMTTAAPVLSDAQTLYDGASEAATLPVKGDATGTRAWLNPGNRWIATSASYDAYGNKVSATDALGNRTETLYAGPDGVDRCGHGPFWGSGGQLDQLTSASNGGKASLSDLEDGWRRLHLSGAGAERGAPACGGCGRHDLLHL